MHQLWTHHVPTPVISPSRNDIVQLKAMADCPKTKIILNIGGSRFETCVSTLQQDPSAILSYMILKESPLKPYKEDNVYNYFLDTDPRHFVHILNNLRSECSMDLSTFPRTVIALRELQRENSFYNLTHLHCILEKRILDILQGHLFIEWLCIYIILHGRWQTGPTIVISVSFIHSILQFPLVSCLQWKLSMKFPRFSWDGGLFSKLW